MLRMVELRRLVFVAAFVLAGCLITATPAGAAISHSFEGSFEGVDAPGGPFAAVTGVAADSSGGPGDGDVWVADSGALVGRGSVVDKFEKDGSYVGVQIDGSSTPAGSLSFLSPAFEVAGIAVDNSTGANSGDLYVADIGHGVIDRFGEDGAFQCQITGRVPSSPAEEAAECNGAAGSQTPGGSLVPLGLAVGASGDLYVGSNGVSPANEQQVIRITGASSGTYTLSFAGETTSPIAFDATSAAIQSALEALRVIGAGGVSVRGAGARRPVTFEGPLAETDVEEITADTSGLNPGAAITVSTERDGAAGSPASVDVFGPDGGFVRRFTDPHITEPSSLAVGADGEVYVGSYNVIRPAEGLVTKFSEDGAFVTVLDEGHGAQAVAVDPAGGHVYVYESESHQIAEFGANGGRLAGFGEDQLQGATAVSLAIGSGAAVFAGQLNAVPPSRVASFSRDLVSPSVTTGVATDVAQTTAVAIGHVDPDAAEGGGPVESCRFEYEAGWQHVRTVTLAAETPFKLVVGPEETAPIGALASAASLEATLQALAAVGPGNVAVSGPSGGPWTVELTGALANATLPDLRFSDAGAGTIEPDWSATSSVPCSPPAPYPDATDVNAELTSLAPGTTYHYRLVAENADLPGTGRGGTFTTSGPPSVGGEEATAATTSATVRARVNPFGLKTTCEVQYVEQAAFEAGGYAGARAVPCAEGLGSGFAERSASATLVGLRIGGTYHYRFLVVNEAGTELGADESFVTFGIESFSIDSVDENGRPDDQAGDHPYEMNVSLALHTTTGTVGSPEVVPANPKTIRTELPPGLIGDPTATPRCEPGQITHATCPGAAQVGTLEVITTNRSRRSSAGLKSGLYAVVPPAGVAAQFAARFNGFVTAHIDAGVRTGADYGVTADSLYVTAGEGIKAVNVTLWGVPADQRHDAERECPAPESVTEEGPCSSEAPPRPFLTNPTSCTGPLTATLRVDSWQDPGNFATASSPMPAITGCDELAAGFRPTISARPSTSASDSPSGLHVDLHVPQNEDPDGLATADLKDTTVVLPPGVAVNPSAADGLGVCTEAQVELHGPNPANCPDGAKIGSVEVDTPLLDHPLPGAVYIAQPHRNPFGSLLAIYIGVHDPQSGVVVKLAGHVIPDQQTGQLTTVFSDNPQLPFEDFKLDFFGGPRAALMTPPTCGTFSTETEMTPWSGTPSVHPSDHFAISSGANDSPCAKKPAQQPNHPSFSAGTVNPLAGAYSPFVINLGREDGSQRFSRVDVTLPPGLVGRLASIPYCPQSALVASAAKPGMAERAAPSCPAASKVGTVDVAAGAGPRPIHVGGDVYLGGPYRGAPLSLAIITPAVAGPYDLGTVVVRTALYVDPETAQITAKSDPIPTILQGVPIDIRSITLNMDRADFTLNPTSCEAMALTGTATSASGHAAALRNRFQVGDCGALKFRPHLKLRLKGATRRTGHPAIKAVVTYPKKGRYANIARAQVGLPHSEFLDQGNLNKVCKQADLRAATCPKSSIYGHAKAWTPLLDKPLQGPVYLGVGFGYKLPALVADLNGQIRILLVGRVDTTRHKGIRNTFEVVPDAPVSRFVLTMKGGRRYGLIENSEDLCAKTQRASALFNAQNGLRLHMRPKIATGCKHRKHRKSRKLHSRASTRRPAAHRRQRRG